MIARGLILDFGGVLTTRFRTALTGFCQREGLSPDELHRVLRHDPAGRAALAAAELGEITQRQFEQRLGPLLGIDDVDLVARIGADLHPCPAMLDLVRRARTAGVATAVLSNSWGAGGYDVYTDYDLPGLFDAIVISDQVGLRKPDSTIYELTVNKLGVPATGCVFADDVPANLEPAAELGMATVLVDEPEDSIHTIARMLNLPDQ